MFPWHPAHNISEFLLDQNQDSVVCFYYFYSSVHDATTVRVQYLSPVFRREKDDNPL